MEYHQTLSIGFDLIGEFRILRVLGSGGFANTYVASETALGRQVAIKEFFPSELAVRSETSAVRVRAPGHEKQFRWGLERFAREAKTLAKFRHPNIVRVFRVFEANDTAYISLEYVKGSDLERWLVALGRAPTQTELDELVTPLLDALEVVHGAGILHRDVKPANIYIRESDKQPVLIDFGAARFAVGEFAGTTAAIVSKGYSPHEAYATDPKQQGPWTDIYGLAATIYRALSGAAPPESTSRVLDDDLTPCVRMPALSGIYRPEFLVGVDAGLALMPRARPQSIADWRRQMFSTLVGSDKVDKEVHVIDPEPRSGPNSFPPVSLGVRRSTPQPNPIELSLRPQRTFAARAFGGRSVPKLNVTFALGATLLIGGAAALIAIGSGLPQRFAKVPGSHTVADDGLANPEPDRVHAMAADNGVVAALQKEEDDARRSAAEAKAEAERAMREREAANAAREKEASEKRRVAAEIAAEKIAAAAALQEQQDEKRRVTARVDLERVLSEQKASAAALLKAEDEERRIAAQARADQALRQQAAKARQKEADEKRRAAAEAVAKQIAAAAAQQREEDEKRRSTAQTEQERVLAEQKAAMLKNEAVPSQGEGAVAGQETREPAQGAIQQTAIEPNSQKPTELKPLVVSASIGPDLPTETSRPLTEVERVDYVKRVQETLKSRNCYRGEINGDLDDTAGALKRFDTSYDGNARQINLASATLGDYEDWLSWSSGLKVSCRIEEPPGSTERTPPVKVQKAREQPVETEKETRRPNREARSVDRESRPARQERSSPPARASNGGGGAMTGVGF
jgi:serine/threonine protein kinase